MKSIIILIRKPCNQIQVLMDISETVNSVYTMFQFFQIHMSMNSPNRLRIRWLHTDFQLNQSRAHLWHQLHLFLSKEICGNFKVKVCHTIIMFQNIFPDCHSMFMFTVKSTVHKFHLWNSVIQEKLQFFFDQFQIPETKFLIYGRQTVATGKRASPAALIINDSVLKFLQMLINKWNCT